MPLWAQAADRGDYAAGLFGGYSRVSRRQSALFISRKIFVILHQAPARSLKPSRATARSAPFFIPDWVEFISHQVVTLSFRCADIGVIGRIPAQAVRKFQNRRAHRIIGAEKYPAGRIKLKNRYGYIRQRNGVLTPAIDILGVSIGLLSRSLCCHAAISSSIWGAAQPLRFGEMIRPSTLIMGFGLLSAEVNTLKRGIDL